MPTRASRSARSVQSNSRDQLRCCWASCRRMMVALVHERPTIRRIGSVGRLPACARSANRLLTQQEAVHLSVSVARQEIRTPEEMHGLRGCGEMFDAMSLERSQIERGPIID